jgi:hypothetical protein
MTCCLAIQKQKLENWNFSLFGRNCRVYLGMVAAGPRMNPLVRIITIISDSYPRYPRNDAASSTSFFSAQSHLRQIKNRVAV